MNNLIIHSGNRRDYPLLGELVPMKAGGLRVLNLNND